MPSRKKILIVAGEPSGDLHASNLIKELKIARPALEFFGIGGELMRSAGAEIICGISGLAVVGVVEAAKQFWSIQKAYNTLLERITYEKPDLAILTDYPGFNLRLAKELKKRSIPVIYYISPQVWAWGRGRIKTIKECVKKIIVFFKFEEELYRREGIDAEFVGHPLLDVAKASRTRNETCERLGIDPDSTIIALLAGSRESEVRVLLPIMLSAANILRNAIKNAQFVIAKFKDLPAELYDGAIESSGTDVKVVEDDIYNVLAVSDLAVVASGTATLETAIIGTPLIITYKTNPLTWFIGKRLVYVLYLGIVNIIAGKEVAPELLQSNATPERIAAKALELLGDKTKLAAMCKDLSAIKASLGNAGAYSRAARTILPLI